MSMHPVTLLDRDPSMGGILMATAAEPSSTAAGCCAPLGAPSLSEAEAEATARVFKALADPHRVKIVNAGLLDREQRGTWAYYSLRRHALGGLAAALDLQGASR
jgi:ArsR family transcriptional regulator